MMTARSWSSAGRASRRRRGGLLLTVLVFGISGCVPPAPDVPGGPAAASPDVTAPPPVDSPASVDPGLIRAREELGGPAVALVEGAVGVVRSVDRVRHEVGRGSAQREAIEETRSMIGTIEETAATVADLVETLEGEDLGEVTSAAGALVGTTRRVTAAAARELADLEDHTAFDEQADVVVDDWTASGSRSDFRARMAALVDEAETLVGVARRLPATPPACPGMRVNRIRWATTLASRTVALQDVALAAEGAAYDALRSRFAPAPYGEDRVVADSESRPCWTEHSSLLEGVDDLEDRFDALGDALSG